MGWQLGLFTIRAWMILGFLFFVSGCITDDFEKMKTPDWEPEVAFALVDSRFGIDRVLEKVNDSGSIVVGEDNVVTIVYSGKLFSVVASEIVELTDVSFSLLSFPGNLEFPMNGRQISHIDLEAGKLYVDIEHSQNELVFVELSLPGVTKDNQPFYRVIKMPANQGGSIFSDQYDLSGYTMDLTGSGGNSHNQLEVEYEARNIFGSPVNLNKFDISFEQMDYSFIDGYMGEIDLGVRKDSLTIGLFDKFKSGTMLIEDPRIAFTFLNGFGIPITAYLSNFKGNGKDRSVNLTGEIVNEPIDIKGSDNSSVLHSASTIEFINNGNSNIQNFISVTPNTIDFEFNLNANHSAQPDEYNFLYKESRLDGYIDLEIPLKGSIDSVIVEDEFDFDTEEMFRADNATFKIWTENMFPLGIYIQVYFLNKTGSIIDSLVLDKNVIFKEAVTNDEGFSIMPETAESLIFVDEYRYGRIQDEAVKMKVRAMLLTDDSGEKTVKISADNYFQLKLGLITKLNNPISGN